VTDLANMTPEERRAYWAKDRAAATSRARGEKPKDVIDAIFWDACRNASLWAEQDGLHPKSYTEWNEPRYSIQQGLRAAHVGREDAAATLLLMPPVLRGLRTATKLLWLIIGLLILILWRIW
jgi:hypothetical protein